MMNATTSAASADDFDEEDSTDAPSVIDFAAASLADLGSLSREWARLQELRSRFLGMADAECPRRHTPEQCETWRNRVLRVRTNDHRLALDLDPWAASRAVKDYDFFTLAEARPVLMLAAAARIEVVRQIALYAEWLGGVDLDALDRDIDRPEDARDAWGNPRPPEGWGPKLSEPEVRELHRRARRIRVVPFATPTRVPTSDKQFERSYRHRVTFGRRRDVGWAGHRRPGPKAKAKPIKPSAAQKEAVRLQQDVERVLAVLARCRRPEGLPGVEVQRRAKMKRAAVFAVLAHLQSAGRVEAHGATKKKRFRLVAETSGSVPGSA